MRFTLVESKTLRLAPRLPRASDARLTQSLRFPIALVLGFLVTSALFSFLWALINVHFGSHLFKQQKIEFTRLRRDTDVATIKHEEKPKLEKPVQAPITPQVARASFSRAGTEAVATNLLAAPTIDTRASLNPGPI